MSKYDIFIDQITYTIILEKRKERVKGENGKRTGQGGQENGGKRRQGRRKKGEHVRLVRDIPIPDPHVPGWLLFPTRRPSFLGYPFPLVSCLVLESSR